MANNNDLIRLRVVAADRRWCGRFVLSFLERNRCRSSTFSTSFHFLSFQFDLFTADKDRLNGVWKRTPHWTFNLNQSFNFLRALRGEANGNAISLSLNLLRLSTAKWSSFYFFPNVVHTLVGYALVWVRTCVCVCIVNALLWFSRVMPSSTQAHHQFCNQSNVIPSVV